MSSESVDYAEGICVAVIETLKELRSTTTVPLTAGTLHEALSKKQAYKELLNLESSVRSDPPREQWAGLQAARIRKLMDFRLELLDEFSDISSGILSGKIANLRKSITGSSGMDEILALNDEIVELVRNSAREVNSELQGFSNLVDDIGQSLVEMESDLISSFSLNRESYVSSKAFSNVIEANVKDMNEMIHANDDVALLKTLIFKKLSVIRDALEKKRYFDDIQMKKTEDEAKQLKETICKMKVGINGVGKRAKILEKESLTDQLTGVHNRLAYEKYIQKELQRYKRSKNVYFSILLIDVDGFKSINDRYGHLAGDRCLRELAKLVSVNLRGTDFLARYGGEEFIVILPETDEEGMLTVAEKLRKCIERTRFSYRGKRLSLTISIGCTTLKSTDSDAKTFFGRADAALYEAKNNGRNRVISKI